MAILMAIDWHALFGFTVSPLELFLRATLFYLFLFAIFRVVLKRDVGSLGMADILVVVIIADASQNALAGDYKSLPDGMVVVGTIVGWNLFFDWLAFHSPFMRRLLQAQPLKLVQDGRFLYKNMRRELLTEEDVREKLRENGVEDVRGVKVAYMEESGELSVIPRKAD
ncbi:YetF domain-containing protein [Niveibacterium sp. SC-1]|uniref:DUF421 domain-containing protein n=1 Tax=Niveibacterium sp. SC-1 TaxID=3135646 RepID=UPI00311FBE60